MHIDRKSKAKYYLEKDNKRWEVAESKMEFGKWKKRFGHMGLR